MKRLIYIFFALVLLQACIEEKAEFVKDTDTFSNQVTFLNKIEGYSFTAGEEVELTAPISFEKEIATEKEIDELFDIKWFVNEDLIAEGYRIKYTFTRSGGYSLVLKIENRKTGEIYLSDVHTVESRSAIGWGWMLLSDRDGKSSLSFIQPVNFYTSHNLETMAEEDLGTGPKRLFYYYVKGSIPSSHISGLAKIIVNQESGTVTLDGSTLQKDKWMRDEFQSGAEPEEDFTMIGFSWKGTYYLIATETGNLYMKYVTSEFSSVPFYGTYASMPYTFPTETKIGVLQGFSNVAYWVANEDITMMYDSQNARFIAMIAGNGFADNPTPYRPELIEISHYDETKDFDSSVPPVYDLGQGTKCLALGAYERDSYIEYDTDGETILSQRTNHKYLALLDMGGSKDYKLYQFGVSPMGAGNHNIVEHSIEDFDAPLTDDSVIRFSTDFSTNPYFYFTDGSNKLYVYGLQQKKHALLYEAEGKITHLSSSPLDCPFDGYGGNIKDVNWRLAAVQDNGKVSILDVSVKSVLKFMEGTSPKVELKVLDGFGDVKDIVWATNYVGEF